MTTKYQIIFFDKSSMMASEIEAKQVMAAIEAGATHVRFRGSMFAASSVSRIVKHRGNDQNVGGVNAKMLEAPGKQVRPETISRIRGYLKSNY